MNDRILSNRAGDGFVIPLDVAAQPCIPIDEKSGPILRIRPEWQRWLSEREYVLFATLTYDRQVSRDVAERDLRHFYRRLADKVYGKNPDGLLSFVGFLEFTKAGAPHWHLLFERILPKPAESAQRALDRLAHLVKRVWLKMRNTPFSEVGIDTQPIYDQSSLLDYCLKTAASNQDCSFIAIEHLADPDHLNLLAQGQ